MGQYLNGSAGYQAASKTFKVHLDGYNLMPFFKGEAKEAPRDEFLYWNDDGEMVAIRINDWKVVFKAQEHEGIDVWRREFTNLRGPKLLTFVPIPSSEGTVRWNMRNGSSTDPSLSCLRRLWSPSGLRASRSSQFVRSPRASILMT